VSQQAWLSIMCKGPGERTTVLADKALRFAEPVGDERTIIHTLMMKGFTMLCDGDRAGYDVLEECRKRAAEHGFPFEECRALCNMASLAVETMELEWARDLADRSREIAAAHENSLQEIYSQGLLAWILLLKGDWAAAYDAYSDELSASSTHDSMAILPLGKMQARMGRPEARTFLESGWTWHRWAQNSKT
jgi:hypothetical protein